MATRSRRFVIASVGSLVVAPSILGLPGTATPVRAAPAEATDRLFVTADLVQGSQNLAPEVAASRVCVNSSRFPRNSELVWRARVFDPEIGETMDDSQIESAEVMLGNGEKLPMRYGPHPPVGEPADIYWTASWVVPKDYPTGTLSYAVVATALDGRVGEFKPFNIVLSMPTITDEVLPDLTP